MKTIIYISFILLITSCNPQEKKKIDQTITVKKPQPVKHTAMENEYDYKKLIGAKTEYFDIKYFDEHKDQEENLIYTDKSGTHVNMFGDVESGYVSNKTPNKSMFTIYKQYNNKGVIYRKWVYFRNRGSAVGKKYEFDESGKLISEIDTDIHFKITPQDIIKYCEEKNIDLFSNYSYIERFVEENKSFYNINYRGKYEEKQGDRIIIQIDGTTGEIRRVVCINGKHNDSVETLYDAIAEKQKKEAEDNAYYKTYKGKKYTKKEWEIFEEEWHKNYEQNKNKGFWDDIFPQRKK
ncbi:hypothetical protein [Flavobacterium sp. IB48]|uniref:hypothetical protein n=1 Tax=Flavobacterium sp. IB48 TaxID=2779375 RepID=UPI0018E8D57E|nr:hypothetical protein [Flavobacterium sp. IB48]MBJ2123195.1 hypothetical protein [Flavobacterium sp. IB48]